MIAKVYNALAIVAIANMLALGGFAGFLIHRRQAYARAGWRSYRFRPARRDGRRPPHRGRGRRLKEPTRIRPPSPSVAASGEEVRMAREHDRMRHLEIERARRDVEARQQLLDQSLHDLVTGQEEFTERAAGLDEGAREADDGGSGPRLRAGARSTWPGWHRSRRRNTSFFVYNKHPGGRRAPAHAPRRWSRQTHTGPVQDAGRVADHVATAGAVA